VVTVLNTGPGILGLFPIWVNISLVRPSRRVTFSMGHAGASRKSPKNSSQEMTQANFCIPLGLTRVQKKDSSNVQHPGCSVISCFSMGMDI